MKIPEYDLEGNIVRYHELTVDKISAPFNKGQVESLNRFQQDSQMHPFTCGNREHGEPDVLVATENGWICPFPGCDYTQEWAHEFMTGEV